MKFKVYATDGKDIWEILFISHNKHGDFYYGFVDNEGPHTKSSYHVSGKFHTKSDDGKIYQDHGKGQSLKHFNGLEPLSCFGFPLTSFKRFITYKTYSGGKADCSAFVDIRNYDESIMLNLFLLEPSKLDELSYISSMLENGQIIIFTQTTPWIAVTICEKFNHDI